VETIQAMKSFECLTGLDKTVKVNLSYGQSKDKLLSRVSAFDDIKFVSEKQYVRLGHKMIITLIIYFEFDKESSTQMN